MVIFLNYIFNSSPLFWKPSVMYLGVTFQSNLSWSEQCKFVSAKACKSLNFLRYSLWGATIEAKSITYKYLVHLSLEYACTVCNPHTASNKATLEAVHRCAAQWVCGSRWSPLTN